MMLKQRIFTEYIRRKPALTPILAGSICGGIMLLAWTIGFVIYFRKRYNRKKRKRLIAEGKAQPREKDLKMLQEKVVIPPDPAVLLGHRQPGEMAFPEREHSSQSRLPWSSSSSSAFPKSSSKATTSRSNGAIANLTSSPSSPATPSNSNPKGLQPIQITKTLSDTTTDETPLIASETKDIQTSEEHSSLPKS